MPNHITTQQAADILCCSVPHLEKLLEEGKIPYTKVGTHRRLKREDALAYEKEWQTYQRQLLTDLMNMDQEAGLYDD